MTVGSIKKHGIFILTEEHLQIKMKKKYYTGPRRLRRFRVDSENEEKNLEYNMASMKVTDKDKQKNEKLHVIRCSFKFYVIY